MIIKIGKIWYLFSKDMKKVLGKFRTYEKALARERQIIYFKNKSF